MFRSSAGRVAGFGSLVKLNMHVPKIISPPSHLYCNIEISSGMRMDQEFELPGAHIWKWNGSGNELKK